MRHDTDDPRLMSFGDHLEDLRRRLFYALAGPLVVLVVSLVFGQELLALMIQPVEDQLRAQGLPSRLLATGPAEIFTTYFRIAMVVAMLATGPWIVYQLWLFIKPGLYKSEQRFAYALFPLSLALSASAALFLYYILLPVSLAFLIEFGAKMAPVAPPVFPLPDGVTLPVAPILAGDPPAPQPGQFWFNSFLNELRFAGADGRILAAPLTGGGAIEQQFRLVEYTDLFFSLGFGFALAFQLPVVLMLLGWSGLVPAELFTKNRKFVLFGVVIASAIITPPDPWSLLFLALPLYGLFELGILLMRFAPAGRVSRGFRWSRKPGRRDDDPDGPPPPAPSTTRPDDGDPKHPLRNDRPLLAPPAAGAPVTFGKPGEADTPTDGGQEA